MELLQSNKILIPNFCFVLCKLPGVEIPIVILALTRILQPNALTPQIVHFLGDATSQYWVQVFGRCELHLLIHDIVEDVDQRLLVELVEVQLVDVEFEARVALWDYCFERVRLVLVV